MKQLDDPLEPGSEDAGESRSSSEVSRSRPPSEFLNPPYGRVIELGVQVEI
jgi:hypothetical protein